MYSTFEMENSTMSGHTMKSHGRGRFKRVAGRLGAGAFLTASLTAGTVALTAQLAAADTAYPVSVSSSAVLNDDGTITVSVSGSYDRDKCGEGKNDGVAVDWNDADQPGNNVALVDISGELIDVGALETNALNPADNLVHDITPCTEAGDGNFGPLSHTYAAGTTEFRTCAVMYDVHIEVEDDDVEAAGTGHTDIAGGPDHNDDNSIEKEETNQIICDTLDITATLTLVKVVVNNDTALGTATAADFTLHAGALFSGLSGVSGDVAPGASVDLSETGVQSVLDGYDASSWVCVDNEILLTEVAPGFVLTGSSIVLDVNADVTCTITNDDNGDQDQIPPPPPTTTTPILVVTGSSSGSTVLIAGLAVLLGFGMTMLARRRRTA